IMLIFFFFFQAEDGIRDRNVTGVQTCALPISCSTFPLLRLSVYRWEGKVEQAEEWLLLIKTFATALERVRKANNEMNSYELPERSEERRVGKECRCRRAPHH